MYDQTIKLCASLPHFAELFKAADRRGSAQWQVVRWENILPQEVRPHEVQEIGDLHQSRTEALKASYKLLAPGKQIDPTLPWGVWKWEENGATHYQSVRPVLTQAPKAAVAVAEGKNTSQTTIVRLSETAYCTLRDIADADNKTLLAVLDEAIREYEKKRFFDDLNAFYAELRNDAEAWQQELEERAVWDNTLMDGIDRDEVWDLETRTAQISRPEQARG